MNSARFNKVCVTSGGTSEADKACAKQSTRSSCCSSSSSVQQERKAALKRYLRQAEHLEDACWDPRRTMRTKDSAARKYSIGSVAKNNTEDEGTPLQLKATQQWFIATVRGSECRSITPRRQNNGWIVYVIGWWGFRGLPHRNNGKSGEVTKVESMDKNRAR